MSSNPRIPYIALGEGAKGRLADALKLQSEPGGFVFGGVECRLHPYMPANMACLVGNNGEVVIIDLRTEAEKEALK